MLGIVGVLLLAQVGDWVLAHAIQEPLQRRRAKTAQIQDMIDKHTKELAKVREQSKRLVYWESQSLPASPDVARSLYRTWLLELVAKTGLTDRHVDVAAAANQRGLYWSVAGTVRARGKLSQFVKFLYDFYSANQLHRIQSITMSPQKGSDRIDLVVSVEALILPGADRRDSLARGRADRMAWPSLADYQVITDRNFFGAPTLGIDPAEYAYLTGITSDHGKPQAWFTLRDADKVLKLKNGDTISAGNVDGQIVQIFEKDIVIDSGGERWLLSIGENLTQALALPPEL